MKFLNGVNKELSHVRWPSKKEMVAYSTATLVFILVFALFFLGTDLILATVKTWVK